MTDMPLESRAQANDKAPSRRSRPVVYTAAAFQEHVKKASEEHHVLVDGYVDPTVAKAKILFRRTERPVPDFDVLLRAQPHEIKKSHQASCARELQRCI